MCKTENSCKHLRELYEKIKSETLQQAISVFKENGLTADEINSELEKTEVKQLLFDALMGNATNLINISLNDLENIMDNRLVYIKDQCEFAYRTYESKLVLMSDYINKARDIIIYNTENFKNALSPKEFLLVNLNGRAIIYTSEVLCLLENGYPLGAVARWRSIYELWIYSEFIALNDDEVANKFINQNDKGDIHNRWAKGTRFASDENGSYRFCVIESHVLEYLNKNAKSENCNYLDWKKEYNISNNYIHATKSGLFNSWESEHKFKDMVYLGRDFNGYEKPISNTVGCLFNINTLLLEEMRTEFSSFCNYVLFKLSEKVMKELDLID